MSKMKVTLLLFGLIIVWNILGRIYTSNKEVEIINEYQQSLYVGMPLHEAKTYLTKKEIRFSGAYKEDLNYTLPLEEEFSQQLLFYVKIPQPYLRIIDKKFIIKARFDSGLRLSNLIIEISLTGP